jgi:hypothetical protein
MPRSGASGTIVHDTRVHHSQPTTHCPPCNCSFAKFQPTPPGAGARDRWAASRDCQPWQSLVSPRLLGVELLNPLHSPRNEPARLVTARDVRRQPSEEPRPLKAYQAAQLQLNAPSRLRNLSAANSRPKVTLWRCEPLRASARRRRGLTARATPHPARLGREWRSARSLWRPPSPPDRPCAPRAPAPLHRFGRGVHRTAAMRRRFRGRPSAPARPSQLSSAASAIDLAPRPAVPDHEAG